HADHQAPRAPSGRRWPHGFPRTAQGRRDQGQEETSRRGAGAEGQRRDRAEARGSGEDRSQRAGRETGILRPAISSPGAATPGLFSFPVPLFTPRAILKSATDGVEIASKDPFRLSAISAWLSARRAGACVAFGRWPKADRRSSRRKAWLPRETWEY